MQITPKQARFAELIATGSVGPRPTKSRTRHLRLPLLLRADSETLRPHKPIWAENTCTVPESRRILSLTACHFGNVGYGHLRPAQKADAIDECTHDKRRLQANESKPAKGNKLKLKAVI